MEEEHDKHQKSYQSFIRFISHFKLCWMARYYVSWCVNVYKYCFCCIWHFWSSENWTWQSRSILSILSWSCEVSVLTTMWFLLVRTCHHGRAETSTHMHTWKRTWNSMWPPRVAFRRSSSPTFPLGDWIMEERVGTVECLSEVEQLQRVSET